MNANIDLDLIDAIWMARRYADCRATYVTKTLNEIIDRAIARGVAIEPDHSLNDPLGIHVVDGHFGEWRGGQFSREKVDSAI